MTASNNEGALPAIIMAVIFHLYVIFIWTRWALGIEVNNNDKAASILTAIIIGFCWYVYFGARQETKIANNKKQR
mgnify:CR=1 FL=1|tara:strand:+ start:804 stop:1028 length:225 start_codon:yes stop_codon:yes gene_type:complete